MDIVGKVDGVAPAAAYPSPRGVKTKTSRRTYRSQVMEAILRVVSCATPEARTQANFSLRKPSADAPFISRGRDAVFGCVVHIPLAYLDLEGYTVACR
jgi:hypothetical protein